MVCRVLQYWHEVLSLLKLGASQPELELEVLVWSISDLLCG